jgi:hypothetical protein
MTWQHKIKDLCGEGPWLCSSCYLKGCYGLVRQPFWHFFFCDLCKRFACRVFEVC